MTLEVVVHRLVDHADLGGVEANQFGPQLFDAAPDPGSVAGKVVWTQWDNLSIPEGCIASTAILDTAEVIGLPNNALVIGVDRHHGRVIDANTFAVCPFVTAIDKRQVNL